MFNPHKKIKNNRNFLR